MVDSAGFTDEGRRRRKQSMGLGEREREGLPLMPWLQDGPERLQRNVDDR